MKYVKVNAEILGFEPKQKTVSGKVINKGKDILVAIEDGKNFLVKVVPVVDGAIVEVIEVLNPLFKTLEKLFESLFRRLPTHIDYHGNVYRLTIQPAYGNMLDKVFYLIEKPKKGVADVLHETEDPMLSTAKAKMRQLLKSKELI